MRPRRVLGYARVSSVEQALGTSLEDQQGVVRACAEKRGLKVERMYVEAESAVRERIERRIQMQALMADVRAGDLVLVDKIDRWSRDPEFTYQSVRQIHEAGASIYFVGDDCDPSTPHGDSMMGMKILFAREEHKRIKIRLVGTRKLLRNRGYYADGLAPMGYRRPPRVDGDRLARNVLAIDPADADRVRDVFRRCIGGESINEIADALGEQRDRIADALHNRIYLGECRDANGEWIKAKHAPIIDARTFALAQAALERRRLGDRRGRATSETASWWLRDLARCALCGAKMSAAYAGPHDARRYYFRCYAKCTTRFVRVNVAEQQCDSIFEDRLVELRVELAATAPKTAPAVDADSIASKRNALDKKRERYVEMYSDGVLTREEMRAKLEAIDAQRTKLDAIDLAPPPVRPEQRRAALSSIKRIVATWRIASGEERRMIARSLATAVHLAADRMPRVEWVSAEDLARRS